MRKQMRRWVVMTAAVGVLIASAASAQDAKLTVTGTQPVRESLKSLTGKKVSLRLMAGEEIGGTVAEVGENAVRLGELTGRELFDALIRLDHISAVIIRTK